MKGKKGRTQKDRAAKTVVTFVRRGEKKVWDGKTMGKEFQGIGKRNRARKGRTGVKPNRKNSKGGRSVEKRAALGLFCEKNLSQGTRKKAWRGGGTKSWEDGLHLGREGL